MLRGMKFSLSCKMHNANKVFMHSGKHINTQIYHTNILPSKKFATCDCAIIWLDNYLHRAHIGLWKKAQKNMK